MSHPTSRRPHCQLAGWNAVSAATLLLVVLLQASSCLAAQNLLAKVCISGSQSEGPIFTNVAHVRQLIADYEKQKHLEAKERSCDATFEASFEDLGPLLEPEQLQDICSARMYELVRDYHTKFIHFYLPEATREGLIEQKAKKQIGRAIPPALRDFFILFVKQIEAICKQHLVKELQEMEMSPKKVLDDDDFFVIERYKNEKRRLGFLWQFNKMGLSTFGTAKASQFNDLQILDLFKARASESKWVDDGSKLYVQVRFDDRLHRIKAACEKRFRPVYMELFAPVIKLNNLGYIDRLNSQRDDKELNENQSMRRWHDIIQACEVLKDIEILHDSTAMSAIVGIIQDNSHLHALDREHQANLRRVKILSHEEARELQEHVENNSDGELKPLYDPVEVKLEHKKVAFTPRMWLTSKEEVASELRLFSKDIDHYVWQRTSKMRALGNDIRMHLKNFFHRYRNQIVDCDQTSSIGRLAAFFERHRTLFAGISLLMSVIFVVNVIAIG